MAKISCVKWIRSLTGFSQNIQKVASIHLYLSVDRDWVMASILLPEYATSQMFLMPKVGWIKRYTSKAYKAVRRML
ncbi:MAG: hypothetical protein AAFW75_05135, partial [Cyanobacteria bacterium J06636_16]